MHSVLNNHFGTLPAAGGWKVQLQKGLDDAYGHFRRFYLDVFESCIQSRFTVASLCMAYKTSLQEICAKAHNATVLRLWLGSVAFGPGALALDRAEKEKQMKSLM